MVECHKICIVSSTNLLEINYTLFSVLRRIVCSMHYNFPLSAIIEIIFITFAFYLKKKKIQYCSNE